MDKGVFCYNWVVRHILDQRTLGFCFGIVELGLSLKSLFRDIGRFGIVELGLSHRSHCFCGVVYI